MLYHFYPYALHRPFPAPPPPQPPASNPLQKIAPASANWIEQARHIMAAAEQVRPLVQQYGPLLKQAPTLWKMYRSLQSLPDVKPEQTAGAVQPRPQTPPVPVTEKKSVPWFPSINS